MASQFARAGLPIVDPGNVPVIKIDGLESYEVQGGLVISRYFVIEPIVQSEIDFSQYRPHIRRLCLTLLCSTETQLCMRRQVAGVLEKVAATAVIGTSLLM